eukprot:6489021-Amphidinium_carterae.2
MTSAKHQLNISLTVSALRSKQPSCAGVLAVGRVPSGQVDPKRVSGYHLAWCSAPPSALVFLPLLEFADRFTFIASLRLVVHKPWFMHP